MKGLGDGVLAVFGSATAAVNCAAAIEQAVDLQARAGIPLAVRVGLALGDVTFEDGGVFGIVKVVAAARLCEDIPSGGRAALWWLGFACGYADAAMRFGDRPLWIT